MTFATWQGNAGICAFWPLGSMQVDLAGVRPAPGTYLLGDGPGNVGSESWIPDGYVWHFDRTNMARIVAAGFDHVRLQYEPTPLIVAIMNDDAMLLEFVLGQFDMCVQAIIESGLGLVMSANLTGAGDVMPVSSVLAGLSSANYIAYKAHLLLLAARYRGLSPSRFAIELMNEPPAAGSYTGNWEHDYQPDLHAALRAALPLHTMILTCDGRSSWFVLPTYRGAHFASDPNIIWTYHLIDPPPGFSSIRDQAAALSTWARSYDIDPGNLYAGEFGARRNALRLDRIHLYRDMTTAIILGGHRRAAFSLDTADYGLTDGAGTRVGAFDPLLLSACTPTRVWLKGRRIP